MKAIESLEDRLRNEMSVRIDDSDIVDILEVLQEADKEIERLQRELNAVSSFARNETIRYRDALEKIEMMSNGFVKSLAKTVLNDGMDES